MILADTSVWIDHQHRTEPGLVELLDSDEVGRHDLVVEELALGSIRDRAAFLGHLDNLWAFPWLGHREVMSLVDTRALWGDGLSAIGAHLLGSVLLVPGARLWTRDGSLHAAAQEAGVVYEAS